MKKILIYTGNHDNIGIVDFIYQLKIIFGKKHKLFFTDSLRKKNYDVAVFIENFANFFEYKKIQNYLREFKGKKVLVATEFITPIKILGENYYTLNSYEKVSMLQKFYVKYFNNFYYIFQIFRIYRSLKTKTKIKFIETLKKYLYPIYFLAAIFKSLILRPFIVTFLLLRFSIRFFLIIFAFLFGKKYLEVRKKHSGKLNKFLHELSSDIIQAESIADIFRLTKDIDLRDYRFNVGKFMYFHDRFLGIKETLKYWDFILTSHPGIKLNYINYSRKKTIDFPYFFPTNVFKKKIQKKINLSFSGHLSVYRYQTLKKLKINKNLFNNQFLNRTIENRKNQFIKSKETNKSTISLHIHQNKNWKFSSPTRYINSLRKNELPVIFKPFKDKYGKLPLYKSILVGSRFNFEIEMKKFKNRVHNLNKLSSKQVNFIN